MYEDVISKEAENIKRNFEKLTNENYKLTKGYQIKLNRGIIQIKTLISLIPSNLKKKNIEDSEIRIFLKGINLAICSPKKKNKNSAVSSPKRKNKNLAICSPKRKNKNSAIYSPKKKNKSLVISSPKKKNINQPNKSIDIDFNLNNDVIINDKDNIFNCNNHIKNDNENIFNFNNNYIKNERENIFNSNNYNVISNIDETMIISNNVSQRLTSNVGINKNRNSFSDKYRNMRNKKRYIKSELRQLSISDNFFVSKNHVIIKAENYQYLSKDKNSSESNKLKKYFYFGKRKFIFPGKFNNIYCSEIYIIKNEQLLIPQNFKRIYLKTCLNFIIYFVILFYLIILIQQIQTKFGNNFIQICILPFVTTLVMKYLITFNFMMLITCFILFNFGQYFMNNKKTPIIISLISKIFISPVVKNHYNAIKLYQYLK